MRAVLMPKPPPPPKAPPNAWGPRTYPGAPASPPPPSSQAPPQANPTQQQTAPPTAPQPIQPQRLSFAFKVWFWGLWILWSVPCIYIGTAESAPANLKENMFFLFLIGLFVSLFVAQHRAKLQRFGRTWWTQSTNKRGQLFAFGCLVSIFALSVALNHSDKTTPTPVQSLVATPTVYNTWVSCSVLSPPSRVISSTTVRDTVREAVLKHVKVMPTFGRTGISFDIDGIGKVHDLQLDYPSGNIELDRTSWGSILQASPMSFVLVPAKMGCFFQYGSKTTPETTHYALPTPMVNAPESAQKSEGTVSESWDGTYKGTVHNKRYGVDADISVTLEKQNNASFNGHFSVKRPLYGSGPLTGTNLTDDTIEFHVVPAPPTGYEMHFAGRRTAPGVISGSYSASTGQSGTFTMHLQSTTTSPVQEAEPFTNRFGWYVDQVKARVAQNWYLSEVSDDTPSGATVYVQFQIGKNGDPTDVSVQTSSGHSSLDQSCVKAVERTDNFGPLPTGYKEDSLNVLYHCTVD
jgi:TonB family protein